MNATEKVILNLQDADCSEDFIQRFLQETDTEKRLKLLSAHRRHLLDGIHDGQRKLDILDYLIFTMKQEQNCESEKAIQCDSTGGSELVTKEKELDAWTASLK